MELRLRKTFSCAVSAIICLLCLDDVYGQDISDSFYGDREIKPVQCNSSNIRDIRTAYGTFRGKRVEVTRDSRKLCPVVQFLGIPYAKPPVNGRRWKKPEEPSFEDGYRDATKMGPVCPQKFDGKLPNALLPIWYKDAKGYMRKMASEMSEDCLYLNIYVPMELYANETLAPKEYTNKLPVMVYIHGHTFMEGSGNFYDGSVLASYGKVIVVTINYRLGVLGFLSTLNGNCAGNFGLWDQTRALKWISSNIASFGGDPTRVTLFGSGAGAASINLLMVSADVDGLFHRVILQSGTALSSWTIVKEPASLARIFTQHPKVNCTQESSKSMMACLRSKHWKDLIHAEIRPPIYTLAFGPVIDGELLKDMPEKLMRNGEFMNYPMILGISQGDGYGFIENLVSKGMALPEAARREYEKKDFQMDVDSFVDGFYRDAGEGRGILQRIIEYVYTDWKRGTTKTALRRSLLELYTDKQWLEPAVKTAAMSLECAYTVYFYTLFHHAGNERNIPEWLDAGHGDEAPLVFGYPYYEEKNTLFPFNFTKIDRMISAAMMKYWTNFAKEGSPMRGSEQKTEFISGYRNMFQKIDWPAYDKAEQRSLEISVDPTIRDHYRSRQIAFWKHFLPDLLVETNRAFPFIKKSTSISPAVASAVLPTRTPKTSSWKPLNTFPTVPDYTPESGKGEAGPMSLQLTITLAIGFVLLFVNIIAFSVVSYHKEKDKFKIEKLEAQLEEKKRVFEEELKKLGVENSVAGGGGGTGIESHFDSYKGVGKSEIGAPYTSTSTFADHKSPIKVLPTMVLPELKPYSFRDDSLTSTSVEEQSRPSKRQPFRKYGACQSSVDGSPASMLVCNSKEELSCSHSIVPDYQVSGRRGDYSTIGGGARYTLQSNNFSTPDKYKTYNGRHAVPGTMKLNGMDRVTDGTSWPVVSSVAQSGKPVSKFSTVSRNNGMQNKNLSSSGVAQGSHVFTVHSNNIQENDVVASHPVGPEGGYLARDISCGSKSALLSSPVDKSQFRSDTSESETDRTGSLSRSEAVGSYCVTNNKTMNVITKL